MLGRPSILSSEQGWCRSNTPYFDVSSISLCMYCARRGASKSIVSGSLRSLSKGSTARKNTVCLLLKIWPHGINPELMVESSLKGTSNVVNMMEEFALNHHILLWSRINQTASWMALKNSEVNDYSWIFSTILVSFPPPAMLLFHFSSDQWCQ